MSSTIFFTKRIVSLSLIPDQIHVEWKERKLTYIFIYLFISYHRNRIKLNQLLSQGVVDYIINALFELGPILYTHTHAQSHTHIYATLFRLSTAQKHAHTRHKKHKEKK